MNILTPDNINVLNEVGRWKTITLKNLFKNIGEGKDYSNFCRMIRKLEKEGYLKGFYENRKGKYLTLTEKGSTLSSHSASLCDSSSSILHDLVCSTAMQSLLEFPLFTSGSVMESINASVEPDGIIHAVRYGQEYILAIEVELTQKSEKRIMDKFIQYSEEDGFDHVLYITNKINILNFYRKILNQMKKEVQEKFILSFDENLSRKRYDYKNSICWMKGEFVSFKELFGERNLQ